MARSCARYAAKVDTLKTNTDVVSCGADQKLTQLAESKIEAAQ
jgi:hypothetical protein